MTTEILREPIPTAELLGVTMSLLDMESTLARIDQLVALKNPSLIVTANATAVVLAQDDPGFMTVLKAAEFITIDGAGVQWALSRKGVTGAPKVAGVELVQELVRRSADTGHRIFFLGGEPGIAETAAEKLRVTCPGCNIVGVRHGYFPASDDDVIAQEVAVLKPDILLVGLGMPRQEQFILGTREIIRAPVNIGVGGSFDVLSGKAKRAPEFWIKLKLEWLWRAIINPSKIRKLAALPRFVLLVLRKGK